MRRLPIPGWHRLRSGLRRYLIIFDPPTFVLDQERRPWQVLSLSVVFGRSKNFTSDG